MLLEPKFSFLQNQLDAVKRIQNVLQLNGKIYFRKL